MTKDVLLYERKKKTAIPTKNSCLNYNANSGNG